VSRRTAVLQWPRVASTTPQRAQRSRQPHHSTAECDRQHPPCASPRYTASLTANSERRRPRAYEALAAIDARVAPGWEPRDSTTTTAPPALTAGHSTSTAPHYVSGLCRALASGSLARSLLAGSVRISRPPLALVLVLETTNPPIELDAERAATRARPILRRYQCY
jgi:hypothetical protein